MGKLELQGPVERFLDAYWRMDVDGTVALVTDDFQWINVAIPNFVISGKQQLRDFMANRNGGFPEAIEDGEHVTERAMADGEYLMHERLDRMKLRGSWIEIPCNAIWRVIDGKVALWKDYYDLGAYLKGMKRLGITLDPSASHDPSGWGQ